MESMFCWTTKEKLKHIMLNLVVLPTFVLTNKLWKETSLMLPLDLDSHHSP